MIIKILIIVSVTFIVLFVLTQLIKHKENKVVYTYFFLYEPANDPQCRAQNRTCRLNRNGNLHFSADTGKRCVSCRTSEVHGGETGCSHDNQGPSSGSNPTCWLGAGRPENDGGKQ